MNTDLDVEKEVRKIIIEQDPKLNELYKSFKSILNIQRVTIFCNYLFFLDYFEKIKEMDDKNKKVGKEHLITILLIGKYIQDFTEEELEELDEKKCKKELFEEYQDIWNCYAVNDLFFDYITDFVKRGIE